MTRKKSASLTSPMASTSSRSNSMAADVDSADSLISRCLATQLLNLIKQGQDAVVKYRYFGAGPTKSSILLTFLTDLDDPWGWQGTHAVASLLTPSQNEIAMQLAAGAT